MPGTPTIDDALESSDDRYLRVIARLSPIDSSALAGTSRSGAIQALKDHAQRSQQAVTEAASRFDGVTVQNQYWIANAVSLDVDTDQVSLDELAEIRAIDRLHANFEVEKHGDVGEGDDEVGAEEFTYGLEMINAPDAWEAHGTQGDGVSVAILDTGVDGDHPDHEVDEWAEFDGDGDQIDTDPNDGDGHGTHVAGTAVGPDEPDGDVPAYGVAPDAELWGVKVLDDTGGGTFEQIIAGIEWAAEEDADIMNMSLGAGGYQDNMVEPVENAVEMGTLVVSSIGNGGEGTSGSPGNVYSNFASGAVDENEDPASFSGGEVIDTDSAWSDPPEDWPDEYVVPDTAAPGVDVLSSVPGGGYSDAFSGTSMSSPHMAGAAAIMLSAAGNLDPELVIETFEETAEKPDGWDEPDDEPDTRYGFGIIDVDAATALVALDTGVEGSVELDGEPVEGAHVEIGDATTETDENGAFSRPLEPGEYDLTVSGFGIQEETLTVTVEDGEEFTDIGTIEVDPAVDLTVDVGQPQSLEAGDDITVTATGANVEEFTVEATGDYGEDLADLFVGGEPAEFGEPVDLGGVSGELTVTVETTPDTAGDLGLDHTASGEGEDATASTGPTEIVEELTIVGIIDANDAYGEDIADTLEDELGGAYEFQQATAGDIVETPGNFDVAVAQLLEDGDVEDFVETIETTNVGAVYLDQWGSDANAIPQYAEVSDEVTDTGDGFSDGDPQYGILDSHPIFEGFDEGEEVLLHTGGFEDYSFFETADDSEFTVIADQLAGSATQGDGVAVDDGTASVLATSIGRQSFAAPEDFTDEANQIFGQAVEFAALGGLDTGVTGTVELDGEPVEGAHVELAGSSATTDEDGVFQVFAEPGEYDLTVTGFGFEETTQTVTVEEGDELTDIGTIEVDPAVDIELVSGQPDDILSGTPIEVVANVANLDELTIEAFGDYGEELAELFVNGDPVDFGETLTFDGLTAEVTMTVETTEGTSGELGLEHTLDGPGEELVVETGPTVLIADGPTDVTYGLDMINAPATWSAHDTQGEGVSVAILDSGVDGDHPDHEVDKWQEFDENGDPVDSEPNDGSGHGTHVAGTAVGPAFPEGDVPAYGVAPQADLWGVKVLDDGGGGSFEQVTAGMEWAVEEGADVMNMSLGASGQVQDMVEPSENARDAGIVLAASIGNDGEGGSGSPGNVFPNFASGAVDEDENVAGFSGGEVIESSDWEDPSEYWPDEYVVPDTTAPGVDVLSSVPGGGYDDTYSGTSMSSPHMAGAAALMLSAAGGLDPATVIDTFEQTAEKPDDWDEPDDEPDIRYGFGIINALEAVTQVALDTGLEGVVESDGEPVEGATVAIEAEDLDTETGEDGSFSMPLEPGEYDLTVTGFGIQEETLTAEVEEGEEFTDIGTIEVDPAVELAPVADQPPSIEAGEDVTATAEGANVDEFTVEATGDYDLANAELFVGGEPAEFGEPVDLGGVSGELDVTVETEPGTAGNLGLDHTASGPGDDVTISTGPTEIVEQLTVVGIVAPQGEYGEDIADTLAGELGDAFEFEQATSEDIVETPGFYDVAVIQNIDDDAVDVAEFVETTEDGPLGAVYLDQWGSTNTDAIPKYEEVSDDITDTGQGIGSDPQYEVLESHPIFQGFDEGEVVLLLDGSGDFSFFETTDEMFTPLADSLDAGTTQGQGLAIDDASGTVLAASLGRQTFAEPEDFTDEANEILGNAVEFAATGGLDTGVTGTVELDGEPVEGAHVELAGSSATTDEDGVFQVFAEPGEYDLTVTGFGFEETTQTVTVEEGDELTDIGTIEVDPAVDIELVSGQPDDILSGTPIEVVANVANLEELTIEATGDYDPGLAELFVGDDEVDFGETLSFDSLTGEVTITVETTEDTSGDLGLEHTLDGPGGELVVETGPTFILAEGPAETTYGLDMINAPATWEAHDTQGEGVSVAVLDTGVDPDHPDMSVDKWAHFDEDGEPIDSEPQDGDSHGTHVSGTAVGPAFPEGDAPAYGVAPQADLWGVKVLDDTGGGSFEQVTAGMEWAVEEGADVMNMSLGADGQVQDMVEPSENARDAGVVLAASIGNTGEGSSGSPGNVFPNFASGAVDEDENVAGFSGGEVIESSDWEDPSEYWPDEYVVPDTTAPGVDVLSAVLDGEYGTKSGTSMSSPHMAGAAALMLSAAGGLDPATVIDTFEETAEKPDDWDEPDDEPDIRYGFGIINTLEAVTQVALDTGIEGTVESEGEPVEGAHVEIEEEEITIETDEEGHFEAPLEPGEYTLNVTGFGFEEVTQTVDVEDGDEFTDIGTIELDPAVDIELVDGQPDEILAGTDIEVVANVANVDELTIEAFGDYGEELAELFVNGDPVEFGETLEFDGLTGEATITVGTTEDTVGDLGLEHTLDGPGEQIVVETGPTFVSDAPTDVTYGLDMINAPATWSAHDTQGEGVSVAILDTGVDADHPDHEVDEWAHFDEDGEPIDSEPQDGDGHGTHVAGTAVGPAFPEGDVPGYGVAPQADLWGVKVLDDFGGGTFEQIVAGIEWAVDEGADIMNMSLGADGYQGEMVEPSENAREAGSLLVASIGNTGEGSSGSPGNVFPNFASGAVNEDEEVAGFSGGEVIDTDSAWGDDAPEYWPDEYVVPDTAAPGVDVLSSVPGGGYDDTYSGTSMSSPHMAGAAALMLSAAGSLDPATVIDTFESTAEKPDDWDEPDDEPDIRYGFGIVNTLEAVTQVALDTGLEGTVESEGEPVAGAHVAVEGEDFETETEADGSFAIPLEPGEYDLTVTGFGVQEETFAVEVEDGDEFTDIGVLEVDPGVDIELVSGQPQSIEAGEDITVTAEGANVETFTVEATGDYDPGLADLFVGGDPAEFGEPVDLGGISGELTVTVETTPDTAGDLGLDHTLTGPGEDITVSTGPTEIVEELVIVGIVDPAGNYGEDIADTLAENLGGAFEFQQATSEDIVETPENYDGVVVQRIDDGAVDVAEFVEATEDPSLGAVYLDNWGSTDADAIPQYEEVSDEITDTGDEIFGEGAYEILQDHPIFLGFEEEVVPLFNTNADSSHFTTTDGQFETIADKLEDGGDGGLLGEGLAVDEESNTVLAASLGRTTWAAPGDFTDEANQILANAVEFVATGGIEEELDLIEVSMEDIEYQGTTTLSINAQFATEVVVDGVWADWEIEVADDGGGTPEDRADTEGDFLFEWDTPVFGQTPELSISPPESHVGGEWAVTVTATDGEETLEEGTSFVIDPE